MRSSRRFLLTLLLSGFSVGAVVTGTSAILGRSDCGPEFSRPASPFPGAVGSCHDLVRSLSIRTGVAAGVATVFILLLVAGLLRTGQRIEEDRHAEAMERYREGSPNE